MTTLLLQACQYRRCQADITVAAAAASGYKKLHQSGVSNSPSSSQSSVGGGRHRKQPELAAFAHYFAVSRGSGSASRYTPALAADLPLPANVAVSSCGMSAVEAQAAPYSQQQHQHQHQQQSQNLSSVIRSYSDPDLPGNARRGHPHHPHHQQQQLAAAVKFPGEPTATEDILYATSIEDGGPAAVFSVSLTDATQIERPLNFRHSFNCLLDIDSLADPVVVASPWPTSPPPPPQLLPPEPTSPPPTLAPTPSSPSPLRKVASCGSTVGARPSKKRVQFADEVGKQLRHVRIFSEPSCAPPRLTIKSCFPSEDPDDDTGGHSAVNSAGGKFKCQFPQPSSRYILFRENVEKNCVSLSNLYFDELTANGSIAVKNVSFDKRVFVRVTFDQWNSHLDVEATFASSQDSRQDMFVFSFQCPAECELGFEFCVCYEASGQAFWDSNGGANYKVSAKKVKSGKAGNGSSYTSDYKPNFSEVTDFSEFSVWDHFSDRVYY